MKRNYKNLLGVIIILIGIVIFMQGTDLNPFLGIKSYGQWLNTHYYHSNDHDRNVTLIFFTTFLGAITILIGTRMFKLPKKDSGKQSISIALPDTAVFKEPYNTIIKDIHLDKSKGEITMKLDFNPGKQD